MESKADFDVFKFIRQFNALADMVQTNSAAHGFWIDGLKRNQGEMIALMHSELSEALEGIRKPGPDQHLPGYLSIEVELADCIIRIMDFASGFNLRVAEAIIDKHEFNTRRPHKHGKEF